MIEKGHPSLAVYHRKVGGRTPWDTRFENQSSAPEIRELIISIREKTGLKNGGIGKIIGCSGSTISRLSQGRAGSVMHPGQHRSTTDTLYDRLNLLNKVPIIARFIVFPAIKIR